MRVLQHLGRNKYAYGKACNTNKWRETSLYRLNLWLHAYARPKDKHDSKAKQTSNYIDALVESSLLCFPGLRELGGARRDLADGPEFLHLSDILRSAS